MYDEYEFPESIKLLIKKHLRQPSLYPGPQRSSRRICILGIHNTYNIYIGLSTRLKKTLAISSHFVHCQQKLMICFISMYYLKNFECLSVSVTLSIFVWLLLFQNYCIAYWSLERLLTIGIGNKKRCINLINKYM